MTRARALAPLALMLTLAGCPPELTGTDQVDDDHVLMTGQHDGIWDYASNPVVDAKMDALLAESPGCAVGIMVDGEIDYLHGYGWMNPAAAPGGDTTSYTELGLVGWGGAKKAGEYHVGVTAPIGSVSKPITALAALQIIESGAWTANTKVSSELTTTNADLGNLTIGELLSHNKAVGIDDDEIILVDPGDDDDWDIEKERKKGKVMGYAPNFGDTVVNASMREPRDAFTEFEADVKISANDYYSNVGYAVAGAMIDQYSHDHGTVDRERGYEKWVWTHVAEPHGVLDDRNMRSWALLHSWRAGDIPRQTSGYRWDGASWDRLHPWDEVVDPESCPLVWPYTEADCNDDYEGWEGPSGGWTMTIGDMTRWAVALNDDVIVSEATLNSSRTSRGVLPGVGDYGYGWKSALPDIKFEHDGRIGENIAHLAYFRADSDIPFTPQRVDMAVAIQCNGQTDPSKAPNGLRNAADEIYAHYYAQNYLKGASHYTPGELWLPSEPVGPIGGGKVLHDTLFELHLDRARVTSPDHMRLPLLPDTSVVPLLAVTDTTEGGLQSHLGVGTVTRGVATRDTRYPKLSLGSDSFSTDPEFGGASSGVFKLPTRQGDMVLEQPKVTAHAIERGSQLTEISLSGQLDLRSVPSLGTSADRAEVCTTYGTRGICEPCDDGTAQCLSIRIDHIAGEQVSGSL